MEGSGGAVSAQSSGCKEGPNPSLTSLGLGIPLCKMGALIPLSPSLGSLV